MDEIIDNYTVKGTFESILRHKGVRIVPNRGWSSLTFQHDNIKRLLAKQSEGKIVHVLYFGDFDPSGLRMSSNLEQELQGYSIDFERMALTKPQIEQFGLQHLRNPDPEVLEKLKKDPNRAAFIAENGDLYQIEIDALQKDPERFEELVTAAVDYYFDEEIYDHALNEYSQKDIYLQVTQSIQRFLEHRGSYEDDDDSEDNG